MYKVGGFAMPTVAGLHSIDLGFRPQGGMFMGGNQDAEDVLITPASPGLFFGKCWIDAVSGAIDQQASSFTFHGLNWTQAAIVQSSANSATEYKAVVTEFTDDGFVLNVITPAPGYRPIHYLFYGDMEGAGGVTDASFDTKTGSIVLPYRPTTGLMFHSFVADAPRERLTNAGVYHSIGVGNWPDVTPGEPSDAHALSFRTFTSLGAVGFSLQGQNGYSFMTKTVRPGFGAGSYIDANDHLSPITPDGFGAQWGLFGYDTRHMITWWTAEGYAKEGGSPPNLGEVHTHTAGLNVSGVEAVLFFGTTGYDSFQLLGPGTAYMLGVLGHDYQGMVSVDFGTNFGNTHAPMFFQSTQLCYAGALHGAGVRAASGVIDGRDIHLTGEMNGAAGGQNMIQMYGEGRGASPGFFRVLHR